MVNFNFIQYNFIFIQMTMSTRKQLAIYGTGGHALSALDILCSNNYPDDIYFIEEYKDIQDHMGYKVFNSLTISPDALFIAVGDNASRQDLFSRFSDFDLFSIISSKASISAFSR